VTFVLALTLLEGREFLNISSILKFNYFLMPKLILVLKWMHWCCAWFG